MKCAGAFVDYDAIGRRVREIRKVREISQEVLAEQIDISTTHMSNIETTSTKLSLPVLAALARVLSVSADYLLYGGSTNAHREADALIRATITNSC